MRLLIRLAVFLAVIWCAWWALASYSVSRGVDAWVKAQRAEGWDVKADTSQRGFPLNIRTQINAFSVENPFGGPLLSARGGTVSARTYWPGHLDVDLPESPILITGPSGQMTLDTRNAGAKLRLRPGTALELGSVEVSSDFWRLHLNDITFLQANALTLSADQASDKPARYDIAFNADQLVPGVLMRQMWSIPLDWPDAFDRIDAAGSVTFDAPLDRLSLEENPPQLRQIVIERADIIWGAISVNAVGALDIDRAGIPEGEVTVQAKNWRSLLDLAQSTGALPAEQRVQTEVILNLLSQRIGDPENLDLVLTFQDGQMALNGIPLGDAPRIVLQ